MGVQNFEFITIYNHISRTAGLKLILLSTGWSDGDVGVADSGPDGP